MENDIFEVAVFLLICGMEISQSIELNTVAINILTYVFMYVGVISFTRRVRLQQLQKESEELKTWLLTSKICISMNWKIFKNKCVFFDMTIKIRCHHYIYQAKRRYRKCREIIKNNDQ